MAKGSENTEPYIGSYVLETLTTGMYAESRNALREYIQNSFDGVRAAIRGKTIKASEGRIEVLLPDENTLIVEDNGAGVSEMSAWGTLTAIGLSKKSRQRDAGFRGIGRLAGIAFCNTLTFCTKAAGETLETTITFNCRSLRNAMTSESEGSQPLAQLLQKHVTSAVKQTKNQAAHFMRVTLQDLSQAPREFKDLEEVRDYLTETSPVSFDPSWAAEKEIRAKAASAGLPIEAVSIYLGHSKNTATPIYKAYGEAHQVRGGSVTIQKIKYFQGVGSDWCFGALEK